MNILLYGGGVDSTSLLAHLKTMGTDLVVMHCDYGQKAFRNERKAAKYFCNKYGVELVTPKMDLTFASCSSILNNGNQPPTSNTKLELRNVVLISLAGCYLASNSKDIDNTIFVGYHKEPNSIPYPDAVLKNVNPMSSAMTRSSGIQIKIEAPFKSQTREHIYKLGYTIDKEVITKSYTCYDKKECGVCPHCLLKKEILTKLGV